MNMKAMQIMLIIAAILVAIGIAVALNRDEIDNPEESAKTYNPSGLMKTFDNLVGPPMLSRDELTREGRQFPSSLRLPPDEMKEFTVAPGDADQRRASFRISGQSPPLTITYDVPDQQRFNERSVDDSSWTQRDAEKSNEVSFVIFNKGGALTFDNKNKEGSPPASTVTIRMEE